MGDVRRRVWGRNVAGGLFGVAVVLGLGIFVVREWPVLRDSRAARRALAGGRYKEAWSSVERWMDARPGSAEAQYLRARVALALGRRRDLFEGMKRADSLGLSYSESELMHALVDANFGRNAQAREVLRRAFESADGPDPQLDESYARVLMETYDFPNALTAIKRWTVDAPADPTPYVWRGSVHARMSELPEVLLEDYREALTRDPNQPEARLGEADALGRLHRNAEAETAYQAYLTLKPDDPAGHLGAGRNALELGDLDLAARRIDRALVLDPRNADPLIDRAKLDQRRGDEVAALRHLDEAVRFRPGDLPLRYSRMLTLTRLGRLDEAKQAKADHDRLKSEIEHVDELNERLSKSPGDAGLKFQIGQWMFAHGYAKEGVKWSEKILADHPGHHETCRLLADYYDLLGQSQLAEQYRAQLVRRVP